MNIYNYDNVERYLKFINYFDKIMKNLLDCEQNSKEFSDLFSLFTVFNNHIEKKYKELNLKNNNYYYKLIFNYYYFVLILLRIKEKEYESIIDKYKSIKKTSQYEMVYIGLFLNKIITEFKNKNSDISMIDFDNTMFENINKINTVLLYDINNFINLDIQILYQPIIDKYNNICEDEKVCLDYFCTLYSLK